MPHSVSSLARFSRNRTITGRRNKLGRILVLKARMNAHLHMAGDLKNTTAAADFALHPAPADAICHPVLIHGKRINLRELKRAKVRFRDRRMTIRTGRCNRAGNLTRALSNA